jgi:predicted nucleic acid-binding protein
LTFLDAYALVALLADEPAGTEVEELLRAGSRVVAMNLAETVDISQRVHGIPSDEVRAVLEPLFIDGALSLAISEEAEAWSAAALRIAYYGKEAQLSMADCFLLAHAVAAVEPVATSDPAIANVARNEGVDVIALPDSSGARP